MKENQGALNNHKRNLKRNKVYSNQIKLFNHDNAKSLCNISFNCYSKN
jgi:hypothetical protein